MCRKLVKVFEIYHLNIFRNQNSTIQTSYENHTVLEGNFQYNTKTIENFNIIDKFATCDESNSTTIDLVCTKYGKLFVSCSKKIFQD